MKKLLVLALGLGVVAACAPPVTNISITPGSGDGGDSGEGGAGGSTETTSSTSTSSTVDTLTAHGFYVNKLHPSLIQTCGGCHNPDGQVGAPAYLDYDAELSYPMTKNYPNIVKDPAADSILITKGPHEGPGVTADQKALIEQWISLELSEDSGSGGAGGAGGSGSGGPQTLEGMLDEFAGCMDYDFWLASGMDKFPLQQTNGDGPCMSCHNTGVGATYLSGDPQETFDNMKMFPYIMRLVKPVYEGSTPVDLVASDRFFNKGKEPCQNPPICHPKFDLTPENKAALEDFVGTTLTKWQSGQCNKP